MVLHPLGINTDLEQRILCSTARWPWRSGLPGTLSFHSVPFSVSLISILACYFPTGASLLRWADMLNMPVLLLCCETRLHPHSLFYSYQLTAGLGLWNPDLFHCCSWPVGRVIVSRSGGVEGWRVLQREILKSFFFFFSSICTDSELGVCVHSH